MDWTPIADMPAEWKTEDGSREVLWWRDDLGAAVWPSHAPRLIEECTHYAIITPPEATDGQ